MHLIIEGYVGDAKKVRDAQFIHDFLDTCSDHINMTRVSAPQVSTYQSPGCKEPGVSGFILLAESHISLHIPPGQSYMNIDLFSCKGFTPEQAIEELRQNFGLTEVRSYLLNRPESGIEV